MAIEQGDLQRSASNGDHVSTLNFLSIFGGKAASAEAKSEQRTTTFPTSIPRGEAGTLDFSAPVFPQERGNALNDGAAGGAAVRGAFGLKGDANRAEITAPNPRYDAEIGRQLAELNSESRFTSFTRDALLRDAGKFPPVTNSDGSTTFTLEQFGMSNRDMAKDETSAYHYKRLVEVTIPPGANTLSQCSFAYHDRQKIGTGEFNSLVMEAQKKQLETAALSSGDAKLPRPEDMTFFTHGIRTAAVSSDFYALTLQLTNGHSVVNVDWKSVPPSEEKGGITQNYLAEREKAKESYPMFEKALDDTINLIGSEQAIMIAFSHGAMFDTNYLKHRQAAKLAPVDQVIFTHPDVPLSALPQPDESGNISLENKFYSHVSRNTHVIGSARDLAMAGASASDYKPPETKDKEILRKYMEEHQKKNTRLGSGAPICRNLVEGCGGTYVAETIPEDKGGFTKHFINMNGISGLINNNQVRTALRTAEK